MKKLRLISSLATIGVLFMALLLLGSCNKKEAPAAPTHLKAVVDGDCIHLSWRRVPNADFYRITVGFQTRDSNNVLADIYEVFLCETSDHTYNDRYPFDGMNYYKIEAVNEYGSSPCSEVSCDYSNGINCYLYPNPAVNQINVGAFHNYRSTVTNLLGDVFFEWELHVGVNVLDMSQLNSGIYLLHVYHENKEAVMRFVIKRI